MNIDHERLKKILADAVALATPQGRASYLDAACGDDTELRTQVESLLKSHERAGDFLEQPAFPPRAETLGEGPGSVIGRYQLLEQIGEGGMGVVYRAEQTEPLRREVALKVIKLGMTTKEVLARFEAERQALAMMDHPNIAHVHDGGTTDNGRPYFVMELVRGVPITEYCDANKLPPRARIGLFRKVCEAVQHAHQKGIIHRDLKPSNILVTVQDDQPVPKVIDFGVAKVLTTQLTERTLFTRFNQWVGTPAYMSPEQAGPDGSDIDTRSDVYSLGVILYELLTGNTPFDQTKIREEGYDAMLRTIRDEDPPKPSTRLSSLPREDLRTVAADRGESPEKLGRELRGELDWILLKALNRDRSRRYATANALANELGRYSGGEAISAVPPTLGYRAGKIIRKHWKAATITASFVLLIIASALTSAAFAVRANTAAARATRAEGVADQQKELALQQRDLALTNYYVASMARAWRDWQIGNVNRTADTLMAFLPQGDLPDLRGWEWYYLASLLEEDENVLHPDLGPIRGVTFSADGARLAVAGEALAIYDRQSKQLVRSLPGQAPIAWHPKQRQLAAVTTHGEQDGVTLWDIHTGDALRRIRYDGPITCMSWRPDGAALAWAGPRGFGIWEEGTDAPEVHPRPRPDSAHWIRSIAWSPDGRLLAMGVGFPGQLLVWSAEDRSFCKAIDVWDGSDVINLDWSAANGQLAHGTHQGTVYCWDVEAQNKVLHIAYAHGGILSALAWSPDGNWLATGGNDQLVKVWDPGKQGSLVTQFAGHRGAVESVAWTPDGSLIASGAADGSVRLWRPDRDQASMSLSGKDTMTWSPDGRKVATKRVGLPPNEPDAHDSLLIYDAQNGTLERELDLLARGRIFAWSPDGNLLGVVLGDRPPRFQRAGSPDGNLVDVALEGNVPLPGETQVWDVKSGRLVHRLPNNIHIRPEIPLRGCIHLTWSPDGSGFATCGADQRIKIWETARAKLLHTLEGHEAAVGTVRWSPDGRWLLSADWNRHVKIWDAASWECLWDLRHPRAEANAGADGTYSTAWSPDSRRIATRSGSGDLVVWELTADRPPRRVWSVRAHSSNIRSVDWSPDGRRIASSSEDSLVKVWDAATGREMLSFDHPGWVLAVAWSPDGTRLAAADGPMNIILIRDARKALGVNWEERLKAADQVQGRTREAGRSAAWRADAEGPVPVVTE